MIEKAEDLLRYEGKKVKICGRDYILKVGPYAYVSIYFAPVDLGPMIYATPYYYSTRDDVKRGKFSDFAMGDVYKPDIKNRFITCRVKLAPSTASRKYETRVRFDSPFINSSPYYGKFRDFEHYISVVKKLADSLAKELREDGHNVIQVRHSI